MNKIVDTIKKTVTGAWKKGIGAKEQEDAYAKQKTINCGESLTCLSNETLKMYAYEMLSIYLDRTNEKILSRGFSFNSPKDIDDLKDLQSQLNSNNSQPVFNNPIVYYSIADIVKISYMGSFGQDFLGDYKEFRTDMISGKACMTNKVYYAFYFGGLNGSKPAERKPLLGIVHVIPREVLNEDGKIIIKYQTTILDKEVTFDPELVFQTPYAKNINAFLLGLEGVLSLLITSKSTIINGTSDYKIFSDTRGFLDKDTGDYEMLKKRLQPFVNGETNSIILGNGLGLDVTKGESAKQINEAETTLSKDIMSFIADRPRSIMFGEPVSGLNSSHEEDLEKEEDFLTSKAKLDYIPIFKCFCDIFGLNSDGLDFNSYFDAMRTIRLTKEFDDDDAIDEAILYEKRKSYYRILNMKGTPPPIEHHEREDSGKE